MNERTKRKHGGIYGMNQTRKQCRICDWRNSLKFAVFMPFLVPEKGIKMHDTCKLLIFNEFVYFCSLTKFCFMLKCRKFTEITNSALCVFSPHISILFGLHFLHFKCVHQCQCVYIRIRTVISPDSIRSSSEGEWHSKSPSAYLPLAYAQKQRFHKNCRNDLLKVIRWRMLVIDCTF